ncbi:MAG TPA: dinitrogenase iron-molybdenum cofactor biosynthesis protein [Clostridia bacterium]|nr:dinitrogenase iron-molybdenum cofactor biosynthesis protein [Clostridia bacterium]
MKMAVCSQGTDIDSQVDSRFGRCPYFVIVDPETGRSEAVPNPGVSASGGAGVQSAQLLSGRGVDAIAVGNVGPNAVATLAAAGIKVYTGLGATVKETIDRYHAGRLVLCSNPTVTPHHGLRV